MVGPKSGWEFSLHLQRPCLAAHVSSELRRAALQLLLLFYHLVLAPSTFRVVLAILKSPAEDLVLLPHPALSCNKAWKALSGPNVGYGWRATTISEGKQNQTDERLRHELHELLFTRMARTAIHRSRAPEMTTIKLDMRGIARNILLLKYTRAGTVTHYLLLQPSLSNCCVFLHNCIILPILHNKTLMAT